MATGDGRRASHNVDAEHGKHPAFKRALNFALTTGIRRSFSCWFVLATASGALGCGDVTPDELGTQGQALGYCSGAPLISTTATFEFTGQQVVIDTCQADALGNPQFAIRDALSGAPIDFAKAAADDADSFHEVHSSTGSKLDAALNAAPQKLFDVDVWFRIDMSDAPDKVDELASAPVAAHMNSQREARTRAAATKLASQLAQMPGVSVMTSPTAPLVYGVPTLRVKANRDAVFKIGNLPTVWRVLPVSDNDQPLSAYDFDATIRADYLDSWGYDGTGQTVAILEGNRPDAYWNLPGDPGGNCAPDPAYGGPSGKCHCPSGQTHEHSRMVMGTVRANPAAI